jgi:methionyl-tRNA synthetase
MAAAMSDTVLLVTPPPTPNGPLHVGHLSGPYVAGDIAARHLRAQGRAVLTQCGVDANQNYVLTRAEQDGADVTAHAAMFTGLIRRALAAARVEYDVFADPLGDKRYRAAVPALLTELVEAKAVDVAPVRLRACVHCGRILHHARVAGACGVCGAGAAGGTCETCGSFLTAADLAGARSTCCSAGVIEAEHVVPVLRLEEYRARLCEHWAVAVLPPRLRRLVDTYLRRGLPDVPLAYPTDWGIEWGDGLRVDVWAEMALANLYLPARALRPDVTTLAGCTDAWSGISEQWIFLGVDNAFYYAVMIPALHLAAGLASGPTGLQVNEFYRLTGAKFSTSRNHAVWAHEFLATEDPAAVRAYVGWDRPDHYESDFTPAGYEAFRDWFHDLLRDDRGGRSDCLPAVLADAELTRGECALDLATFSPPTAVRAALAAYRARPDRAGRLLAYVTGTG